MKAATLRTHDDFYQRLRAQFDSSRSRGATHWPASWKDVVLAVPDFFYLLVHLVADERVPLREKAKLGAAIAYFVSPFDVLPEAILGPFGYLDDLAVAAWAVRSLLENVDAEVVEDHWPGNGQAAQAVAKTLAMTQRVLGARVYRKAIKQFLQMRKKGV